MKLAEKIFKQFIEGMIQSPDEIKSSLNDRIMSLDFEGVTVNDVEVEPSGDTIVSFVDEDKDEMVVLFSYDDEDGATAVILQEFDDGDSEDDNDEIEVEIIDLNPLEPKIKDGKFIDMVDLSWLNSSGLFAILNAGDYFDDEDDNDDVSERSVFVVRGGKKVKLALVRRKRRKRLTPAQRAGVRKAVRKRKAKKGQINRSRKKSLKLRRRSKLKRNTNKRLKVRGTSS